MVRSLMHLADAIVGDELVGELLQADLVVELLERDRRGTGVAQARQCVDGPVRFLLQ